MNDFSELENELKKLRPAPVSESLLARLEQAMAQPAEGPTAGILPQRRPRTQGWGPFLLGLTGVAALFIIGLTFFDHSPEQQLQVAGNPGADRSGASSGFRPAGLSQVVYAGRDEGLIFLPNDSDVPRRRLRYESRQTMRWRNPKTGASVRVSYPVEQVVLQPVSFE